MNEILCVTVCHVGFRYLSYFNVPHSKYFTAWNYSATGNLKCASYTIIIQ